MNRTDNRRSGSLAVLGVSALLVACAGSGDQSGDGAPLARQLTVSDHCGLTGPGLIHLESAADVKKIQSLENQRLNLPSDGDLDFSEEHIVLVALGQKNTGGYGLTLDDAMIEDDILELRFNLSEPGEGAMTTQALTTPCIAVAVSAEGWRQVRSKGDGLMTMTRERDY